VEPIGAEQLARWRLEATRARRAKGSAMDADVVLALLDEVERLRRAIVVHATTDNRGVIPSAMLSRWRADAEAAESNPETWQLANRLLAAMDEIEGHRSASRWLALATGTWRDAKPMNDSEELT
jgi:hypothetical protein